MIIIEGPDGAGKSTLIRRMRKQRDFITVALGGPVKDVLTMNRAVLTLDALSVTSYLPIVCDRHPIISEPIYGPILRGSSMLPPGARLSPADRVIYCRPSITTIFEGFKGRDQLEGVAERLKRIISLYDEAMSRMSHLRYNWTDPSDDAELESFLIEAGMPWK